MYVACRQDYDLNQTQKYMDLETTFSLVNTDISPMTERGNMHVACSIQQNFLQHPFKQWILMGGWFRGLGWGHTCTRG